MGQGTRWVPTGRNRQGHMKRKDTGQWEWSMYALGGLLPFLAPTGTGPVLCLSSSEAEDAVQEEEEAHLRLVVPGMLQLSRYLARRAKNMKAGSGIR